MTSGAIGAQMEPAAIRDDGEVLGVIARLKRRPVALVCVIFLGLLLAIAIFAPILLPGVAEEQAGELVRAKEGPSGEYPLGTDTLGRDVLERLLVGTRITLIAVAEALVVSLAVGVPLGLAAGYLGGRIDRVVGWLIDLTFSVPGLIVVLVVLSVFQNSTLAAMLTIGLLSAPGIARVVRAVTLPIREELYIAAARASGLSRRYIVVRHVLPRIGGVVIVQGALLAALVVVAQAGLSFLGVLDNPPAPSWGGMIADGMSVLQLQPWLIVPPGVAIALTVLALTLLGDALRDATSETWSPPQLRRRAKTRARANGSTARTDAQRDALLSVEHLTVAAASPDGGTLSIVEDMTFHANAGEAIGIVGESGCGKTMTAMAILGLLPGAVRIEAGNIFYGGRDLAALSEKELGRVRGKEIALISQEPMVSLTPTFRVGWQIAEAVRKHHGVSRRVARARTLDLLEQVRLPDPERVARSYLHELSGGMAQRVAIARAFAGEPKLLIADEPTTALDVTVQAEILNLLRTLQREREMAILLITHDWGVVADLCDRTIVMYAGEVVEQALIDPIFSEPLHPYTKSLLESNPHHAPESGQLPTIPGSVPRPGHWPEGCHFHPRCGYATGACRTTAIPLERPARERETRCIHHDQLAEAR